jgi:predicted ArsR family transcriptional regulator
MSTHGTARQRILVGIKHSPGTTIAAIAGELGLTYEAVRQQIAAMEREGWVRAELPDESTRAVGRPLARYHLTVAGEHTFPKLYDHLTNTLIATAARTFGHDELTKLLAAVTEQQIAHWMPLLEGRPLEERLEMMRELYMREDPFTTTESGEGDLRLIERNCPYLNTALEHPELCSTSVSTLRRLLGFHVERVERFQSGQGRCVFRVDLTRPIKPEWDEFAYEPPAG